MSAVMKSRKKDIIQLAAVLLGVIIFAVAFNAFSGGKFLVASNINSMCINAAMTAFMAWGYCFVFALGYMDLSVGAAMILTGYAAGELGNRLGIVGVLIGGLLAGIILMQINFNIFAWTGIPSWIAGLGLMMIYEAAASLYTDILAEKGEVVVTLDAEYRALGQSPFVYVILAAGFAIAYIVYNRTTIGINVRAIGHNASVADGSGISLPKTLVIVGIVVGIFIGCSGLIRESYSARIFAQTGLTSLSSIFQPLATYLLAQVVQKKINIIIAVPFCALFIYMCFNVLTILQVPSGTLQDSVLGGLVIIFGIIAQRKTREEVK